MAPVARHLSNGKRLHLQHGPSDLIVMAEGQRDRAFRAAAARFETIIAEVVAELPNLRTVVSSLTMRPRGRVARRMHDAVRPLAADAHVTGMAAVAGAIADEVLAAMTEAADLSRAYVNNGGDIALHLAPGTRFRTAISGHDGRDLGRIDISDRDPVRGIATSGRHGRSLSLGIADSVTVLARNAAAADAGATLVANAVDLPGHPAVSRRRAVDLVEDSDLGDLPVVVGCGALAAGDCAAALDEGVRRAQMFRSRNLIAEAGLFLQGRAATTGGGMIASHEGALNG